MNYNGITHRPDNWEALRICILKVKVTLKTAFNLPLLQKGERSHVVQRQGRLLTPRIAMLPHTTPILHPGQVICCL